MLPDFLSLHDHLPPLTLEHPVDWQGPCAGYLRYYRLDFSQRMERVRQYLGVLSLGDYRIAVHVFLPREPRGTVIVNHGYFDHTGLFDHVIDVLLREGYAVVGWDLPGHGLSSGEPAAIGSFDEYQACYRDLLDALHNRLPKPWHGVGQSTGGAILLRYLSDCQQDNQQPALAAVVALAPLVRVVQWPWVNWQYRLAHRYLKTVRRVFARNADNAAFLDFVRTSDPLQAHRIPVSWVGAMLEAEQRFSEGPVVSFPVRVIQGDHDTTVNWRHNLHVIREKFPQATINVVPGGGHHLVNEARERRAAVFGFVLDECHRRENQA